MISSSERETNDDDNNKDRFTIESAENKRFKLS